MIQSTEELNEINGQAVQREIVNKVTGEVSPVLATAFGDGVVEFTTEDTVIQFENKGDNTFEDNMYLVREV